MTAYAPAIIGYSTAVTLLIGLAFLVSGVSNGRSSKARWLAAPFLIGGAGGAFLTAPWILPGEAGIPVGAFLLTLAYGFGWLAIRIKVGYRPRIGTVMLCCLATAALSFVIEPGRTSDVACAMSRMLLVGGFNALAARDVWLASGRAIHAARLLARVLGFCAALEWARVPFAAWLPKPLGAEPTALWAVVAFNAQAMIEVLLVTALLIALPRERQAAEHLRLARRDPLTDLGNRRALEEWLARRGGCPGDIALLTFDLDHFKSINDNHGHATGDQLLRMAADVARRVLPDGETIYRIGGDEFLGILPITAEEDVRLIADRLTAAFRHDARLLPGGPINATLSVGTAIAVGRPMAISFQALLERADAALYAAKRARRETGA